MVRQSNESALDVGLISQHQINIGLPQHWALSEVCGILKNMSPCVHQSNLRAASTCMLPRQSCHHAAPRAALPVPVFALSNSLRSADHSAGKAVSDLYKYSVHFTLHDCSARSAVIPGEASNLGTPTLTHDSPLNLSI